MLLLPMLLAPAGEAFAQVWHHVRKNETENVQSGSASPVALSGNPTADWHAVTAGWNYEKGDFHRPDNPDGKSELDVSVEELSTVGKFRTEGSIRYRNTRDFARNWSSLIGNDPDNPYIICDTLADNSTTERFDLGGRLVWSFAPGWVAAGSVGLTTATLSDIKDPRPRNDISRIPLTIGIQRDFGSKWALGIFGGAELFRSDFKYYLEDGQKAYRYYKMMGMGEFFAFSSSDSYSAPREYSGLTWSGGINALLKGQGLSNFAEIVFRSGNENGRDGGSAYEWKSGDYGFMQIGLLDRIDIPGTLLQSISVRADMKMWNGYWYDQKRTVDTEHGNIVYYEVKSRYLNNDAIRIKASADYRIGKEASWSAKVGASFCSESITHFADGDPCDQSWTTLGINAEGWKTINIGYNILDVSAGAAYILPLGEAVYASGNTAPAAQDISKWYVAPAFAYETSGKLSAFFRADWVFAPVKALCPGLFVKGTILKQMGTAPECPALEGTSYYGLSAGAFLKF